MCEENTIYIDITNEWLKKSSKNNGKIKILQKNDMFNYKGKIYVVDMHHVKYRMRRKELAFVNWLARKTGFIIQLNPEVELPEGVSVADCTIFYKNKSLGNYDMKIVSGKSNQLLYHNIYKKKNQATKFLFEATDSQLNMVELKKQASIIFEWKASWVEEIGIKKDEDFLILKNKKIKK